MIKDRGVGFEYVITTGDSIVRDNFFSGFSYSLSMATS